MDNNMVNANNKQFNTAATTPQQGKVNNTRSGFFGTKAKWIIGGLVTAAAIVGATIFVKKRKAKKAAEAAPADQPAE